MLKKLVRFFLKLKNQYKTYIYLNLTFIVSGESSVLSSIVSFLLLKYFVVIVDAAFTSSFARETYSGGTEAEAITMGIPSCRVCRPGFVLTPGVVRRVEGACDLCAQCFGQRCAFAHAEEQFVCANRHRCLGCADGARLAVGAWSPAEEQQPR